MNTTRRTPIDIDTVEHGDLITAEQVERMTGVDRSDYKAYILAKLHLTKEIERLLDQAGKDMIAVSEGDAIRIPTRREADQILKRRKESVFRRFARDHHRQLRIDISEFDSDERAAHNRTVAVHGAMLQAAVKARSQKYAELTAHKRQTPGLLPG